MEIKLETLNEVKNNADNEYKNMKSELNIKDK